MFWFCFVNTQIYTSQITIAVRKCAFKFTIFLKHKKSIFDRIFLLFAHKKSYFLISFQIQTINEIICDDFNVARAIEMLFEHEKANEKPMRI